MIYYRFSLLFALCITCLGFTPNKTPQTIVPPSSVKPWRTELVAQATSTKTKPVEPSSYDRYMQAGYAAARKHDYIVAKEQFQKALAERPQDLFAQQASQNMELYLGRNPTLPLLWLILGGMAIAVGSGVGVLLISRMLPKPPQAYNNKKGSLQAQPLENRTEIVSELLNNNQKSEKNHPTSEVSKSYLEDSNSQEDFEKEIFDDDYADSEFTQFYQTDDNSQEGIEVEVSLPVQTTRRIPSLDEIEELLKDLESTDPKKRRKAIWKLAQKSDSRAMKPLVDLMIDTDSQERSLILEALSQISTRTLKPMNQALAISLQDKNPQVRQNAIRDLTRIYDLMSQISQLLAYAIDDADIDVKETAKWALNQLNLQMPTRLDLMTRKQNEENSFEESYTESAER